MFEPVSYIMNKLGGNIRKNLQELHFVIYGLYSWLFMQQKGLTGGCEIALFGE